MLLLSSAGNLWATPRRVPPGAPRHPTKVIRRRWGPLALQPSQPMPRRAAKCAKVSGRGLTPVAGDHWRCNHPDRILCKWKRGPDLNRRPSAYEADELPGCSTPHQRAPQCNQHQGRGPLPVTHSVRAKVPVDRLHWSQTIICAPASVWLP